MGELSDFLLPIRKRAIMLAEEVSRHEAQKILTRLMEKDWDLNAAFLFPRHDVDMVEDDQREIGGNRLRAILVTDRDESRIMPIGALSPYYVVPSDDKIDSFAQFSAMDTAISFDTRMFRLNRLMSKRGKNPVIGVDHSIVMNDTKQRLEDGSKIPDMTAVANVTTSDHAVYKLVMDFSVRFGRGGFGYGQWKYAFERIVK